MFGSPTLAWIASAPSKRAKALKAAREAAKELSPEEQMIAARFPGLFREN